MKPAFTFSAYLIYQTEPWTDVFYLDFPVHICRVILLWKEQHTLAADGRGLIIHIFVWFKGMQKAKKFEQHGLKM